MTLIELILVVVILVVLALMLFPANGDRRRKIRTTMTRLEIISLVSAIKQYEMAYDSLPVSTNVPTSTGVDFTFGTFGTTAQPTITNTSGYQANNSEVMAVLLARTHLPDGRPTHNVGNMRNPQKHEFLNVRVATDTNSLGFGPDGVFRDPWGNPYIISLDLNGDGRCRDAFYARAEVSELGPGPVGHFGLTRPDSSPTNRHAFEANAKIMVWSFGPDGKADVSKKANQGVNKDNVLSWK